MAQQMAEELVKVFSSEKQVRSAYDSCDESSAYQTVHSGEDETRESQSFSKSYGEDDTFTSRSLGTESFGEDHTCTSQSLGRSYGDDDTYGSVRSEEEDTGFFAQAFRSGRPRSCSPCGSRSRNHSQNGSRQQRSAAGSPGKSSKRVTITRSFSGEIMEEKKDDDLKSSASPVDPVKGSDDLTKESAVPSETQDEMQNNFKSEETSVKSTK